ncbi:GTP-binding protein protease [Lactobacillus selangorensis]|uniref:GTPase HflX n=1 Tax=Lactobacillus selangorensis TaxID=81857 RepID=A0A0R2FTY4_9LACO|nr:GTPase HflX [Lactobacillus selangorensis]KRN28190.1 GTP-binding protein protease [Lactobacillus selangorensis]KRN30934.1 GTP-binding protein protease [Lactobacillus selangorensis]
MEAETNPQTRVIITGVSQRRPNFDYTMTELGELATANDMQVVGDLRQIADRPIAATYFGTGKVAEIKAYAEEMDAAVILVNDELSPSQIRNLEKETGKTIIDRTQLILDIFANRAQTKQAKYQVEIAQLQYQLPRLHPSANRLDQQGGGGGLANRGAGETKLEMNRRVIQKRITHLRHALKEQEKTQETQSQQRAKSQLPVVALVGYTNAGKSTTMNGLLKLYSEHGAEKQVFTKNMLFATLDTSVREITLPSHQKFLLSDTVGFVSRLPHNLVEAFKATLSEAVNADLIIQVVDYADPNYHDMIAVTDKTLAQIGAGDIPRIDAFNKADLRTDTPYPEINGNEIVYSATDKKSLAELATLIEQKIAAQYPTLTYLFPYTDGKALSALNEHAAILKQDYQENGTLVTARINPNSRDYWSKYEVD